MRPVSLTQWLTRLVLVAVLTGIAHDAHAVLKEQDMAQTLSVLCSELTMIHRETKERTQRFHEMNRRYNLQMIETLDKSHRIELMLYSQKSGFIFDQTYACNQAIELYDELSSNLLPFEQFEVRYDRQIKQYNQLAYSLEHITPFILKNKQMQQDRDSCLTLAREIAADMAVQQQQLQETRYKSELVMSKSKELNDYALKQYENIRKNIFINGEQPYWTILKQWRRVWYQGRIDLSEKYRSDNTTRSEWRGAIVAFLFIFIAFYSIMSALLSTIVIRFLIPTRWQSSEFKKKLTCIIVAASAIVFSVAMVVINLLLKEHNFMIMASGLLAEYGWLVSVIMLSLLIRLNGDTVASGMRMYVPIIVVGFIVFVYRITFTPNTIVNLTFPALLLLTTIWQGDVIRRHNSNIPRSDMFYSWTSLVVMVTAVVMAWLGYTLMSVQLLIWWIMQLTVIQCITVLYDLLNRYRRHRFTANDGIHETWFFDAITKMVIPILATFSVAGTIYWAAKVFDLTEWCIHVFTYRFVDIPDIIVISLHRLLLVIALGFVFGYIIYVSIEAYKVWKENQTGKQAVSLSMNIMKYVGWGLYIYIVMVTFGVNRAGITLILTGLSTGIGFAMKDTIENLFYGLSLMSGRVKIGDVIECDGIRGKVSNINYQSTLVETIDGSVVAFLNSQLFSKNFKNMTRNHGYELAKIPVGVAYGSKVNSVRDAIINRLSTLSCYDRKKGINVLFENFGDSSVDLIVAIWVRVASRVADIALVKENIYEALNENGIEIPFPQADIHIKPQSSDK